MAIETINPVIVCRSLFVTLAIADISVSFFPSFQDRFRKYGARQFGESKKLAKEPVRTDNLLPFGLEKIASLQVPHAWFAHFYIISVISSILWAFQIINHGTVLTAICSQSSDARPREPSGMTVGQVLLAWVLMTVQGGRRLYESIALTKPSSSKMPVLGYLVGILFYVIMGVAIWVEASPSLLANKALTKSVTWSAPSWKTIIALPLFTVASLVQHNSHAYLASLRKYTLPEGGLFSWIICPHYTSECVIYLALAIITAPVGMFVNVTLLSAVLFVVTNLSATAESTRKWSEQQFGSDRVQGRWRMFPFVY